MNILDLATRDEGVTLDEINESFGTNGFDTVDSLSEEGVVWLDDQEGIVYSFDSPGLQSAINRYTGY
jgi:hypothetical protein